MTWRFWLLVATVAMLSLYAQISRADTVSCDGKRSWQRQIVRDSVWGWFQGEPNPDDLISLIQAEHGIVACASLGGRGGSARALAASTRSEVRSRWSGTLPSGRVSSKAQVTMSPLGTSVTDTTRPLKLSVSPSEMGSRRSNSWLTWTLPLMDAPPRRAARMVSAAKCVMSAQPAYVAGSMSQHASLSACSLALTLTS